MDLLSLRSAWSTYRIPGQPELHSKTLSQKRKEKSTTEVKIIPKETKRRKKKFGEDKWHHRRDLPSTMTQHSHPSPLPVSVGDMFSFLTAQVQTSEASLSSLARRSSRSRRSEA